MTRVIFSIDHVEDIHVRSKFEHHLDVLRAMGKIQYPARSCIGRWRDPETGRVYLEPSYMVDLDDYEKHVAPHGHVNHQDCVMEVGGASDGYTARLVTPVRRELVSSLGYFVPHPGKGQPDGDWTYLLDPGEYWVTDTYPAAHGGDL